MKIFASLAALPVLACMAACGSSPGSTSATSEAAAFTSLDEVPPIGSFTVNGAEKLDVYEAVDGGTMQDVTAARVGRHYWEEEAYGIDVSQDSGDSLHVKLRLRSDTLAEGSLTFDKSWDPASAWAGTLGTDADHYVVRVVASELDANGKISAVELSLLHYVTTERTETQSVQATNGKSYTETVTTRELDIVTFVTGAAPGYHAFED